jgi:hypothetical protein
MSIILDRYAFLPWARRGLATKITEPDNFNNFTGGPWAMERPKLKVKVKITAKKGGTTHNEDVVQDVSLIGPGDIIGIDQNLVIKTEPKHWVTNFEPNYFPYVEFYEEDFPWRYSPAAASGHKLRPWLTLIALKESEFERDNALFGSLPSIRVIGHADDAPGTTGAASKVFPNPAQIWAWAHVHLNGDVDATNALDPNNPAHAETVMTRFRQLVQANPDQAYSRIICPRKLDPFTTYHCFVIPSFETGRLAGLGASDALLLTHEAQRASFGAAHVNTGDHLTYVDHFPIYYEWQFMTGEAGDFESLVRKLKPIEVDQRVGRRPMDIQTPGFNINYGLAVPPQQGTLMLEGVLIPPMTVPPPPGALTRYQHPWDFGAPAMNYRQHLADLLNLSEDLMKATFPPSQVYGSNPFNYSWNTADADDDPIITPDMYGRYHTLLNEVKTTAPYYNSFFHELNLDPRNRAIAGMGVRYVKENQERLMDRAWDQLGEVIEANRKLRWGQMAQQVSHAGYNKHLKSQPVDQAAAMAGKMFGKVKSGAVTAAKVVVDSALPSVAQSAAFRKIERPNGPLMRRMDPNQVVFNQNSLRVNLASTALPAVATYAISDVEVNVMERTYIDSDVTDISGYTVAVAKYAPAPPYSTTISPDYDEEVRFQSAVARYNEYFEGINWPTADPGTPLTLAGLTTAVVDAVSPLSTVATAVYAGLTFESAIGFAPPPPQVIVPVMAYPVFPEPMYEAVKDLDVEYLVPNLKLIPENSITLLESNQRFVEAFMVGLNHEFGRELLWREYPTDQRGSYFRQFWDSLDAVNLGGVSETDHVKNNLDIQEIHLWDIYQPLGQHSPRPGAGTGLLVLVIRGELLKKFPNTVIYAQKAKFKPGGNNLIDPRQLEDVDPNAPNPALLRMPVFGAFVENDIYFIGFTLTAAEAKGNRAGGQPGWFFVIQERPGEIRFGVDVATNGGTPATWNDLRTGNAPFVNGYLSAADNAVNATNKVITGKVVDWGFNSTNMAQILYQNPVLLAVHAEEMIA